MGTATIPLLTAEDFWLLPEGERRLILVRGVVVEEPLPGGEHGAIVATFGALLVKWARERSAGAVGVRAGFILARDPDSVLAPDVHFVRADRLPAGRVPARFYGLAPDLAVEVVSASDTAEDIQEKVRDYLAAGSSLVVLVYPRTRMIAAHSTIGLGQTYREDEAFSDATVLPGFSCRVAELFS
jgi:Uma2 family endonuclease